MVGAETEGIIPRVFDQMRHEADRLPCIFEFYMYLLHRATGINIMQHNNLKSISWMYNPFLSSLENEKVQGDVLCKALRIGENSIKEYHILNRRSRAVFPCSILSDGVEENEGFDAECMLSLFVSNRTRVWSRWRATAARELKSTDTNKSFEATEDREGLGKDECRLLDTFLEDTRLAYNAYRKRSTKSGFLHNETWNAEDSAV
ncbi:hypothetical protein K503DRAFT_818235 [Rhizopogon vinicolor AM-OR11-026]|uniref:Uncharacterized protein n=1 Tax=Rhizopogon vinicolor AM-OR11-026 TaxID=1314800 RepID=A0A1B7MDT9_9AGAM|nr:hypothetical protein K503DRAFT_818235 [Rhizopogon vinicolor AM-OR11-026]